MAFFSVASVFQVEAQTVTVLQTGGGLPLVSQQQILPFPLGSAPELVFQFGFATEETPAPNAFLDSFSVSIQNQTAAIAQLVTIDASGPVWAPTTPGAFTIQDSQIQRSSLTPPSQAPILGMGTAYNVNFPIPVEFTGSSLTVYFDLFDNQDANRSLGWFSGLQIISVPEPQSLVLGAFGAVFLLFAKKFRR